MEIRDETAILMVEPAGIATLTPVIDELTRKMTAAWRRRRDATSGYRGVHACSCGARSSNRDHWVTDVDGVEFLTNSLCIHYLAHHRADIPEAELEKVRTLTHGESEPTTEEPFYKPFRKR